MKYVKTFEKFKYFSDAIRADAIEEKLKEWEIDGDCKEDDSEEPDMDSLLNPYDGYNKQTYIQYVDDNTFIYYEGWSKYCWEGAYSKPMYKGKNKEDILNHFKEERMPELANELNMSISSFEYWYQESWEEESGYIIKVVFKH